jgi:chromosome segregation ATPase
MKHWMSVVLLAIVIATPAWAANESREKQMLRRMQQQVQQTEQARAQAEQEKIAALADKAAAESELKKLDAAERKLSTEQAARGRAESGLKSAQSELDTLKMRLAETEKKLADSVALQRATADKLAQSESVRKQTEQQLAGKREDLKLCQAHNGSLYTLGREMMQKYQDKSCQDALAQAEPFTGLKKIEVENLMETWRDQLDRDKLAKDNLNAAGQP